MPVDFHSYAAAVNDTHVLDNALIHASRDGTRVSPGRGINAFSSMIGSSRRAGNRRNVQEFLDTLAREDRFQEVLQGGLRAHLEAMIAAGSPLTAGEVRNAEHMLRSYQAQNFAAQCADGGQLPDAHSAWRFATFMLERNIHLDTDQDKTAALKAFLRGEFIETHSPLLMKAGLASARDERTAAPLVRRLADARSGGDVRTLFNGYLDGCGRAQDIHFEDMGRLVATRLARDAAIIGQLAGETVQLLSFVPDPASALDTLADAQARAGEGFRDLAAQIASQGLDTSTAAARGSVLREFMTSLAMGSVAGFLAEKDTQLHLPAGMLGALMRNPGVVDAVHASFRAQCGDACPTMEQAQEAVKTALDDFFIEGQPLIEAYLANARENGLGLEPAVTPERLPAFINVLLASEAAAAPLFNNAINCSSKEYLGILENFARAAESAPAVAEGVSAEAAMKAAIELHLRLSCPTAQAREAAAERAHVVFGSLQPGLKALGGRLGITGSRLVQVCEAAISQTVSSLDDAALRRLGIRFAGPGDKGQAIAAYAAGNSQRPPRLEDATPALRQIALDKGVVLPAGLMPAQTIFQNIDAYSEKLLNSAKHAWLNPADPAARTRALQKLNFDGRFDGIDIGLLQTEPRSINRIADLHLQRAFEAAHQAGVPLTQAAAEDAMLDAFREIFTSMQATLSRIDALPAEGEGAFSAADKALMKEMAQRFGILSSATLVKALDHVRGNNAFGPGELGRLLRPGVTAERLCAVLEEIHEGTDIFLKNNGLAAGQDSADGVPAMLLNMALRGLNASPQDLDELRGALAGPQAVLAIKTMNMAQRLFPNRILATPQGMLRSLVELRRATALEAGADPGNRADDIGAHAASLEELGSMDVLALRFACGANATRTAAHAAVKGLALPDAQRHQVEVMIRHVLDQTAPHEKDWNFDRRYDKNIVASLMAARAQELLAAPVHHGQVSAADIFRAVTGERMPKGDLSEGLAYRMFSFCADRVQRLRDAAYGHSEGGRTRGVDTLAAFSGLSFPRICALMRPGAELTLADLAAHPFLPADTSGLRPDNAYGLIYGWGFAAPGSAFRFVGTGDGRNLDTELTRWTDFSDTSTDPAARQAACDGIIAKAGRLCQGEAQKTRLLQCLSAMPPKFLREIVRLLPGMNMMALGPLDASAARQDDGSVAVTIENSPDSRLRFSARLVIHPDGSYETQDFRLARPLEQIAVAEHPAGPLGPIPTVTLADDTVLPLAHLAGTRASKAAGATPEAARTGLAESAKELLKSLSDTGGEPYALPLTRSLGMMKAYTDRLIALGTLRTEDADKSTEGFLAAAVEALSADELQQTFRQLSGEGVTGLRSALHSAAMRNPDNEDAMSAEAILFTLDALVLREINIRMENVRADVAEAEGAALQQRPDSLTQVHGWDFAQAPGQRNIDPNRRMTDKTMDALVDTIAGANARMGEAEKMMQRDYINDRQIHEGDLKRFGDALRDAPLTVNIDAGYFFSENGPLSFIDEEWKNLFHAAEQGEDVKGSGYRAKRDVIERTMYPQFGQQAPVRPGERPIYGALNLMRRTSGADTSYGAVSITLKDEVKRRCVFSVGDTFQSVMMRNAPGRAETFKRLLGSLEGLSLQAYRGLGDPNSPLSHQIDAMMADFATKTTFKSVEVRRTFDQFLPTINPENSLVSINDSLLMQSLFLRVYRDTEATHKNYAGYENIESLLPQMTDVDVMQLINGYAYQNGVTTKLASNYIEAHIHGEFSLANDVKEITVERAMAGGTEQEVAYMEAVMDVFNGRKIPHRRRALLSQQQIARLTGLRTRLAGRTIPMRWSDRDADNEHEQRIEGPENVFQAQHFSLRTLNELLERIQDNGEFRAWLDRYCPGPLGGLQKLFAHRAFPPEEDLESLRQRFMYRCAELAHHPEQIDHVYEPDMVAIKRALIDVYGQERFEAARQLAIKTNQLISRANHVDEDPQALRTAAEFATRILHGTAVVTEDLPKTLAAAMSFSAALTAIAAGEDLQIAPLMKHLAGLQKTWFADAAAAEGFRTALAALEGPQRETVLHRLEAHRAELLGLEGTFARLGHADRGLANSPNSDGMKTCALALHHLVSWADTQQGREAPALQMFERDLSLLSAPQRTAVAAAFPDVGRTLDAGYPPIPLFPAPARPDLLPQTQEQSREFLKQILPVYQSHETGNGFDRNTGYHGRGHACRAFIMASALASVMEERGVPVNRGVLLCGIAGHDSGRGENGDDRFENASATCTIAHIGTYANARADARGEQHANPIDALGEQAARELRKCIVNHESTTIESIILNSADSLDIGRVQDYSFAHLSILKGASQTGDPVDIPEDERLRKGLQAEDMLLAKLTDPVVAGRPKSLAYLAESDELDRLYHDGLIDSATRRARENALMAEKQQYDETMVQAMNILQDIPDQEEFLSIIEAPIRANPQLFPLLSRYYLHLPQQPQPAPQQAPGGQPHA